MIRPRMSRIFYDGKFYDYPLKPGNALSQPRRRGVVPLRAVVREGPRVATAGADAASRAGSRPGSGAPVRTFFKTYTEKVWGMPADEMPADWAAQRIKSLSLGGAVHNASAGDLDGADRDHLADRGVPVPAAGPGDDVGGLPRRGDRARRRRCVLVAR